MAGGKKVTHNSIAADLRTPKYRKRVIPNKKNRKFRKRKHKRKDDY